MNNNSILIDRYLQNEMSAAERTAFENQLITDNELQEELQLQQLITKAATTAGVKNEFAKAIRKKIIAQRLIKLGIAVVVVASVLFYALKNNWFSHYAAVSKTENSTNEKFEIDNVADTIIETKDGVVFVIPAHAFNTSSNNVRLEIKTALNAYDIMQNGLSTMSNEAMLQTAGMFYINGFDGDKVLTLTKEIAVSVPADTINTNMQLFDGIKDSSGRINWLNPKLIEKGLRTYDITTLDFYPPKYIPTLKVLGKDYLNKNYTDSLYYSFIDYSGIADQSMPKPGEKPGTDYPYNNQIADTSINLDFLADSIPRIKKDFLGHPYQINPAMIKAIWDKKFNNTILATKEFEERLRGIHSFCRGERFLQIYLNNIDEPLYVADSLCLKISTRDDEAELFMKFIARRDGGVMLANGMQQKLSNYFQQKYKAYKEAAAKTWAKYQGTLDSLNKIAGTKKRIQALNDFTRENKNFKEELDINVTNAYRQIGIPHNYTTLKPSTKYYNVTITTTGWKNLDQYVYNATQSRQSMTYTNPGTGKKAVITYSEINIKIENQEQFDKVLVYLIPDSLGSFQRVKEQSGSFKEQLNALFKYDAIVLAYKGTQAYFFRQINLKSREYVFHLETVTDDVLRASISNYTLTKTTALKAEFDYQLFDQQETIWQVQLQKDTLFREKIAVAIFPCYEYYTKK